MKYILSIINVFIFLITIQCRGPKPNNNSDQDAFSLSAALNADEEGYDIILTVDYNKITVDDIIVFGIVYCDQEQVNLEELLVNEDNFIEIEKTEELHYGFPFYACQVDTFSKTISYRAYYKYLDNEETKIIYSNSLLEVFLYELAKADDSNYSKYIASYVESKIIFNIYITVDFQKHKASTTNEDYQIEIETDYIDIFITITPRKDYYFNEEVSLYINEKEVDLKDATISKEKIFYICPEPNWTKPY